MEATKAQILKALYNGTTLISPAAKRLGQYHPGDIGLKEAQMIIDERGRNDSGLYFDYLRGRMLKIDLDKPDFRLFDRDNGSGRGEFLVMEEMTRPG